MKGHRSLNERLRNAEQLTLSDVLPDPTAEEAFRKVEENAKPDPAYLVDSDLFSSVDLLFPPDEVLDSPREEIDLSREVARSLEGIQSSPFWTPEAKAELEQWLAQNQIPYEKELPAAHTSFKNSVKVSRYQPERDPEKRAKKALKARAWRARMKALSEGKEP
jgi:hypothetical protein